jgi:hypothetical protein
VLPFRPILRCLLIPIALTAVAGAACAQGKLEAHYNATLAGLPIGKGSWVIDIEEGRYSAAASGVTVGLMRVLTHGEGTSAARGTFTAGKLISSIYAATIKSSKKTDETRITLHNGNVKEFRIDPPQDDDDERVPLKSEHEKDVLDPMSASLMRMGGNGDPLKPEACQRTLAIFDGRLRYDLTLAYKRMEQVKADKGYAGPAVVCSVHFTPIAGYVPTRTSIKYLSKSSGIEVWLVPISGTRVLVPFRVQAPTPIGEGVLVAEQFVTEPTQRRAAATSE